MSNAERESAQDEREGLLLRPIGRVTMGRDPDSTRGGWERALSEIELDAAWACGLEGLDGYSHIWVLWVPGRFHGTCEASIRPEGRDDMPTVGVFATRSPKRPNAIAITAVRLVQRQGAKLLVEGLDAYVGTSIVDIKPYLSRGDLIPGATAPDWLLRLWQIHDREEAGL